MEYRRVGSSGLKISAVSVGGWITFGGTIADDATASVLRTAIDGGVNFIDLADVYVRGEAEKSVGKVLPDYKRSELVISSKVFGKMSDDPNDRGLSRKHIMESVERSLSNLGTDYLDLYFCHREDPETPLEETVRAMADLVHQGKILYWGTSVWPAESLSKAHEAAFEHGAFAPIVEQPQYSLLHREMESEVLPTARRLGMGLVVWSPLAGGMLTGKYNDGVPKGSRGDVTHWLEEELTEENRERLKAFCAIAKGMSVEPGQLALAWILQHEEISSVITGATSPEQVTSNLTAVDIEIPTEAQEALELLFPAGGGPPA